MPFPHKPKLLAAITFAFALIGAAAKAENLNNTDLAFSAALPCPSQFSTTPVPTAMGTVTMAGFSCATAEAFYAVFVGDYPKGSITDPDASYTGAINGAANNVQGTVRTVKPFTIGALTGRETWIDFQRSGQSGVVHVRYFIIGDRLYQAMFVGALGAEDGKDAIAFLESFKPGS